jgi:hypothetical protein
MPDGSTKNELLSSEHTFTDNSSTALTTGLNQYLAKTKNVYEISDASKQHGFIFLSL